MTAKLLLCVTDAVLVSVLVMKVAVFRGGERSPPLFDFHNRLGNISIIVGKLLHFLQFGCKILNKYIIRNWHGVFIIRRMKKFKKKVFSYDYRKYYAIRTAHSRLCFAH